MSTEDTSEDRLTEAWQLHRLGFYGAAVITARLSIEQAIRHVLKDELDDSRIRTIRNLTNRLHDRRHLSSRKRDLVKEAYTALSRVAHGDPIDEQQAYALLVRAGNARHAIANPSPQRVALMSRKARQKYGLEHYC